jgi:hypothetical protein
METTHELLYLDKWHLVQWKIMDIHTDWFESFCDRAFEYGDDAKFWGYVRTSAEPLLCRML